MSTSKDNTFAMTSTLPEVVDDQSRFPRTFRDHHNLPAHTYNSDVSPDPYASLTSGGRTPFESDKNLSPLSLGGPPLIGKKFHSMSRLNFAMIFGLIVFLITAVSLGAGLGVPLALARNKLNRTVNYDAKPAGKVDSVRWDAFCPSNFNNKPFLTSQNDRFTVSCGLDFQERLMGTNGSPLRNLAVIVAYDLADCMEACSSLSAMAQTGDNSGKCRAVTFNRMMKQSVEALGGNCILKNSTVQELGLAVKSSQMVSAALV